MTNASLGCQKAWERPVHPGPSFAIGLVRSVHSGKYHGLGNPLFATTWMYGFCGFVLSLESCMLSEGLPELTLKSLTEHLGTKYLTIARWIEDDCGKDCCLKLGLHLVDPTQPDSTQLWVTGSRPNVNSQSCLVELCCCQSVQVGHVQSWSVAVGMSWLMWTDTQRNSTHTSLLNQSHRCRNRGARGHSPPHFPGRGQNGTSAPPPHLWANTYLKIPPTLQTLWWNCYRTATASELLWSCRNVTGGGAFQTDTNLANHRHRPKLLADCQWRWRWRCGLGQLRNTQSLTKTIPRDGQKLIKLMLRKWSFLPPHSHLIRQFVKRHLVTIQREQHVLAQWLRQ